MIWALGMAGPGQKLPPTQPAPLPVVYGSFRAFTLEPRGTHTRQVGQQGPKTEKAGLPPEETKETRVRTGDPNPYSVPSGGSQDTLPESRAEEETQQGGF